MTDDKVLPLSLRTETYAKLEEMADQLGISRTEVMRTVVELGLERISVEEVRKAARPPQRGRARKQASAIDHIRVALSALEKRIEALEASK